MNKRIMLLVLAALAAGWLAQAAQYEGGGYRRSYPAEEDLSFEEDGRSTDFTQPYAVASCDRMEPF